MLLFSILAVTFTACGDRVLPVRCLRAGSMPCEWRTKDGAVLQAGGTK